MCVGIHCAWVAQGLWCPVAPSPTRGSLRRPDRSAQGSLGIGASGSVNTGAGHYPIPPHPPPQGPNRLGGCWGQGLSLSAPHASTASLSPLDMWLGWHTLYALVRRLRTHHPTGGTSGLTLMVQPLPPALLKGPARRLHCAGCRFGLERLVRCPKGLQQMAQIRCGTKPPLQRPAAFGGLPPPPPPLLTHTRAPQAQLRPRLRAQSCGFGNHLRGRGEQCPASAAAAAVALPARHATATIVGQHRFSPSPPPPLPPSRRAADTTRQPEQAHPWSQICAAAGREGGA